MIMMLTYADNIIDSYNDDADSVRKTDADDDEDEDDHKDC